MGRAERIAFFLFAESLDKAGKHILIDAQWTNNRAINSSEKDAGNQKS